MMDGYRGDQGFRLDDGDASARMHKAALLLVGVIGFVIVSVGVEAAVGIPWETTYRVGCIGFCQYLLWLLAKEYREERWPLVAFCAAFAINLVILVSPLTDREPVKEDLMLFAIPDAVVTLGIATAAYKVTNVRQRAVRQQLLFWLVLGTLFCALIFTLMLVEAEGGQSWGHLLSAPDAHGW